jgi:Uma2 family endonuclease
MSAPQLRRRVSVDDYLAGESRSPTKHEFIDGAVYAMAGARNVHNRVATNIVAAAVSRLRGSRCQAFNSDTKIRLRFPTHVRFYYPDASIVCRPNSADDSFQDEPVVLFEVLSQATRRIDSGEKKDAYLAIPSLGVYVLVETDVASVVAYRRGGDEIRQETYDGLGAVMPLPEVGINLPLAEVYENVVFLSEFSDDEPNGSANPA